MRMNEEQPTKNEGNRLPSEKQTHFRVSCLPAFPENISAIFYSFSLSFSPGIIWKQGQNEGHVFCCCLLLLFAWPTRKPSQFENSSSVGTSKL